MTTLGKRLQDRAARVGISVEERQLDKLSDYLRLLQKWNQAINLTALPLEGFPARTLDRLIVEPLIASRLIDDARSAWIDLGSGGGSPAIPLKIVRPGLELTMVEARARRAAFLREVVRVIDVTGASVLAIRFEEFARTAPQSADLLTVRAVKVESRLVRAASDALRTGGLLALFRGQRGPTAALQGFRLTREAPLPGEGILQIWEKVRLGETAQG